MATLDQDSGDVYYVHTVSGDTTWDIPPDFGGSVVDGYGNPLSVEEVFCSHFQ